jgi:two-component system, LytTR family, response regulator
MLTAKMRVLVVGDELLARERICFMLKDDPDIEIIGECSNGYGAQKAVEDSHPDLIFLDIQMPEMNSFAFLDSINREPLPFIIFVTAYQQYAVRAFELCALDYLLKPFDRDRFEKALYRAKTEIERKRCDELNDRIFGMLEDLKKKSTYIERLVIKKDDHMFFLRTELIDWIEAEGNYVTLHYGKNSHLLRQAISTLESQLDPKQFLRIHRSIIVNIERMQELHPWVHGDYRVVLRDGTQLTLTRNYRERLRGVLGGHF